MKRVAGVTAMLILSVSATPMQYVFAGNVDHTLRSLAAAAPTKPTQCGDGRALPPEYTYDADCNVVLNTDNTPTPVPQPPAYHAPMVKYYMLPGIGDKNPSGNDSNYFGGTGLPDFLNRSANKGTPVQLKSPYDNWKTFDLSSQGMFLNYDIYTSTLPADSVILIGHSMGGLRARAAMQYNPRFNNPQVRALVTVGTPNQGAAIIVKTKPAATRLAATLGAAVGGIAGTIPAVLIGGALGFGARELTVPLVDSPSGKDMNPSSAFVNKLNNQSTPLGSNVVALDVIGQNSNIDSFAASGGYFTDTNNTAQARQFGGNFLRTLGAIAIAAAPVTLGFSLIWAGVLFAAAEIVLNFPAWWRNNVMGGQTGDTIVTQDSQFLPASAGGDRSLGHTFLPFAVHTGRYGEYQTYPSGEYHDDSIFRDSLNRLQSKLNVPQS